jgi:hypothetical protein
MIAEGSRWTQVPLRGEEVLDRGRSLVTIGVLLLAFAKRGLPDGLVKASEFQMQNPAISAGFVDCTGVERRLPMGLLVLLLILVLIRKRQTKLRIDIGV